MNRNSNTALWIALAVVGSVLMLGIFVGGVGFVGYRIIDKNNDARERSAHSSTSTSYTYGLTQSPSSTRDPTTTTTTTTTTAATILYGGIAYSGSGAYQTRLNHPDGYKAKADAVAQCNSAIWSKGWSSSSYCGYVSLQTGQCGSVATATVASGWGPTGWASGANSRSVIRQTALDKCNALGQGVCHELISICM